METGQGREEVKGYFVAMRKAGSRPIVVDGVAYRWRIRRRATNLQTDYGHGTLHLTVELAEQPGTVLLVCTGIPHPQDLGGHRRGGAVRPSDVVEWVRAALVAGWKPSQHGPQFIYRMPCQ